jgi:hypothetical protein
VDSSTEAIVAIEKQCLAEFQRLAREIRAGDPSLSPLICHCRAVESAPGVYEKYTRVRHLLANLGVAPLKIR